MIDDFDFALGESADMIRDAIGRFHLRPRQPANRFRNAVNARHTETRYELTSIHEPVIGRNEGIL